MNTYSQEILDFISENLDVSQHELMQMQLNNSVEFNKLVEKMKRRMRIEKAKSRRIMNKKIKKRKQFEELRECDKKAIQMIRNRISAQNSRDRKKQYINYLEYKQESLITKNKQLRQQLEELREQNKRLFNKSLTIQNQLNIVSQLGTDTKQGKIGLALLTLVSALQVKIEETDNTQFDQYTEEKIEAIEDSNQIFHLQEIHN